MTHRSARAAALAAAVLTIPIGLAARRGLEGQLANVVGVALWTVVVAALVMALAPRLSPGRLFVVASAIGVAVELFQLTGIPQALYQRHRFFGLVLGTSFKARTSPPTCSARASPRAASPWRVAPSPVSLDDEPREGMVARGVCRCIMRHLVLCALPLLTGCSMLGFTPQSGTPSSPAAEAPAAPATPSSPAAAGAEKPSAPAGPKVVSISLKNNCKETVKIFFGEKPKFGSGTYSTLSSNTRTSKQMKAGEMIWIVDESQNGVASYTVSESSRDVEITDGCSSWKG